MAVVGETPNIAARLQGLAAPDTVVLSVSHLWQRQGSRDAARQVLAEDAIDSRRGSTRRT